MYRNCAAFADHKLTLIHKAQRLWLLHAAHAAHGIMESCAANAALPSATFAALQFVALLSRPIKCSFYTSLYYV